MKKAIGDNMIRKEWGLEKGLDLVKQAGFDGIELWLGDVPRFQLTTADVEVRELQRRASVSHQPAGVLAILERREQPRRGDPPRRRQHPRHGVCRTMD